MRSFTVSAFTSLIIALIILTSFSIRSHAESASFVRSRFELIDINGEKVPVQGDVVYPDFVPQPQSRKYVNLSDEWQILYDKEGSNIIVNGIRISLAERTPEVISILTNDMHRKLNANGWLRISAPSSNNARNTPYSGYQGVTWYRRVFNLSKDDIEGKNVFIVFHGVNYIADVWINKEYAGFHEGGFTPFVLNITRLVKAGRNEVVVRVDNIPWDSDDAIYAPIVPYKKCDWWNYGGIYRDVYIEIVNRTYIARVDVTPYRESNWFWSAKVRVVTVSDRSVNAELNICIYRASFTEEALTEWSVSVSYTHLTLPTN